MKKVLFVVDEFFPISSAPGLRINSFIKYLAKLVNVEIICGAESSPSKKIKDVKYITLHRPNENKFFRFVFFLISLNLKTIAYCIRHRPDIVVISIPKQELTYCIPFLRMIRQKYVLDIRDVLSVENYTQYLNKFLGRFIGGFLSRIAVRLNDILFSFSIKNACYVTVPWDEFHQKMIRTYPRFKHKIIKISNGVDMESFPKTKPNRKKGLTVAYMGNFTEKDFLLPIFKAISKVKDVNLLLIGKGRDYMKYKEMAKELGISKRCEFVGKVDHKDVINQLSRADLGILFRKPNIPTLMAVSILEYMIADLPVIVNDHDEIGRFVKKSNAGMVIKPNELEHLLDKLSKDKNTLKKYKNNRKLIVNSFDRDIIAKDFHKKIIKRCV